MAGSPAAFMSYVRFDDAHDDGQLSAFRERLSAEIRMQTGQDFPIFQDRNDIAWGQNWQRRIDEALDEVTLLLVIVTPGLFRSPACRGEVERFREHERKLGRGDLILPVYYVSAREVDDPALRGAVAQLASRMRDSFWQLPPAPAVPARDARRSASTPAIQADARNAQFGARGGVTRTEPPTHVVDLYERGDFVPVRAAIEAASPGDRILVRPVVEDNDLTRNVRAAWEIKKDDEPNVTRARDKE